MGRVPCVFTLIRRNIHRTLMRYSCTGMLRTGPNGLTFSMSQRINRERPESKSCGREASAGGGGGGGGGEDAAAMATARGRRWEVARQLQAHAGTGVCLAAAAVAAAAVVVRMRICA